ncbi:uncharacterized protein VTP21DRAFT_3370 [Calcarisporiella thermophila]|uniref:uncharacterized protein n=1 Tax=Calcarisporiella thermophila TaxID=911321 RepID=UPI0037431071
MKAFYFILHLFFPIFVFANPLSDALRSITTELDHQPLNDTQLKATKQYAKLMAVTYCGAGKPGPFECSFYCNEFSNTTAVQYFEVPPYDINGYIARDDSRQAIVIAFKGTTSLTNVKVDKNYLLTPYDVADPKKGLVHLGFRNAYLSAGYEVEVIGHSLGGAMAAFLAMNLWETEKVSKEKLVLVTLGQPRIGNGEFAERLDRAGFLAKRLVNGRDMISVFPNRELLPGYKHHSPQIQSESGATIQCRNAEDPKCFHERPLNWAEFPNHLWYNDVNIIRCIGDYIPQRVSKVFSKFPLLDPNWI